MKQLCALGTLAHNRPFKANELLEYTGSNTALPLFKRKKWVKKVSGGLYPTKTGWRAIEVACSLKRSK